MTTYEQKRFRNLTLEEALKRIRQSENYGFVCSDFENVYKERNNQIIGLPDGGFANGFPEIFLDIARTGPRTFKQQYKVSVSERKKIIEEFNSLFGEYPLRLEVNPHYATAMYDHLIDTKPKSMERLKIRIQNKVTKASVLKQNWYWGCSSPLKVSSLRSLDTFSDFI